MPVPCSRCNEWVDLDDTRIGSLTKELVCDNCFSEEDQVNDLIEEAKTISYDLDNYEEYMTGDRRGWKKNLKELKAKIEKAGYNLNDYL